MSTHTVAIPTLQPSLAEFLKHEILSPFHSRPIDALDKAGRPCAYNPHIAVAPGLLRYGKTPCFWIASTSAHKLCSPGAEGVRFRSERRF